MPSATCTRYIESANQKSPIPHASRAQVRSRRQPVPASAPTPTASRNRSAIGYARLVPTDSGSPEAYWSAVWKTIAALRAATASAVAIPSTTSAGENRARLRSSASMPANVSSGNARKPASAGDGTGGALSAQSTSE